MRLVHALHCIEEVGTLSVVVGQQCVQLGLGRGEGARLFRLELWCLRVLHRLCVQGDQLAVGLSVALAALLEPSDGLGRLRVLGVELPDLLPDVDRFPGVAELLFPERGLFPEEGASSLGALAGSERFALQGAEEVLPALRRSQAAQPLVCSRVGRFVAAGDGGELGVDVGGRARLPKPLFQ